MSTIDNRVVRMEFDNQQFESGVSTTMGTLAKLKEALKFKKGGFDELQKGANSVSLSPLGDQIYTVQQRFSLLGEFAKNVFDRISNKVIDTATTLGKAFTIEPITAGFQEYETQMNAVQTIMANTQAAFADATTEDHLAAVNNALDELNTYADKTIYNFTEMTRNIGTFTAAGVDLNTAKDSIQGIANLAAVSGSNSMQASTAMYQLSQAISTGALKLQDWNSVVNAGMGGQVFQDALKKTAREHGVAVDKMIEKNGSFRESLQEGWISADILTETLGKMTDVGLAEYFSNVTGKDQEWIKGQIEAIEETEDREAAIKSLSETLAENGKITQEDAKQYLDLMITAQDAATKVKTFSQLIDTVKEGLGSGWTQSMEYILGDFEEAKDLWSGVYKEIDSIITPIADARNEMLKFWHDAGGRTTAINAISDAWQGVKAILGTVGKAYSSVFPPMTGDKLLKITNRVADLAKRFRETAKNADNLKRVTRVFTGLFSVVKMVGSAVSNLWRFTQPFREVFDGAGGEILKIASRIGAFLTKMAKAEHPLQYFIDGLNGVGDAGERAGKIVSSISGFVENLAKKLLALVGINISGTPLQDFVKRIQNFSSTHMQFPSLDTLKDLVDGVMGALSKLSGFISSGFNAALDGLGSAFDSILGPVDGVVEAIGESSEKLDKAAESFDLFGGIKTVAKGLFDSVAEAGSLLSGLATSVSEAFPKVFEFLGSPELKSLITNFNLLMTGKLIGSIDEFIGLLKENKKTDAGGKGGFWDLVESVKTKAEGAIDSFDGLLGKLKDTVAGFEKGFSGSTVIKTTAIAMLVHSIVELANLDTDKMANGIVGVAAAVGILVVGLKSLDAGSGAIVSSGIKNLSSSLIKMAIAIGILSLSVKSLSSLNMEQLTVGLLGIGGAMGLMVAAVAGLARYGGSIESSVGGMIAIAVAIRVLAGAVKTMSGLGESLDSGLAGVGVLLTEMGAFSRLVDSSSLNVSSAVSVLLLVNAIKVLESSVSSFASMKWETLKNGLYGVGVLLGELAVFSTWANADSLTVSSAISVLLLATALKVLESSVQTFATLKYEQLRQGLVGIGIMLAEIAGFSAVLGKVSINVGAVIALLAIVGAITALSKAVKTMGGNEASSGIYILAASLVVLVGALGALSLLGNYAAQLLTGVVAITALSAALNVFVPVLQAVAAVPKDDLVKALLGVAGAFTVLGGAAALLGIVAPQILLGSLAFAAFGASLGLVAVGLMSISANLLAFVGSLGTSAAVVAASAGAMGVALITLITSIGVGLASGITQFVVTLLNGTGQIIEALGSTIHTVGDFIVSNVPYLMSVLAVLVAGVLQVAAGAIPQLVGVVTQLAIALIQAIVTWVPPLANTLVTGAVVLANSLAEGIRNNGPQILAAIRNIISAAAELVLTALADIVGLIPGVGPMLAEQLEGAKDVVREHLAPESLEAVGADAVGGITSGVDSGSSDLQAAGNELGSGLFDSVSAQLADSSSLGTDFTDGILSSLSGSEADFTNAGNMNVDAYLSAFTTSGKATGIGDALSKSAAKGAGSQTSAWSSAAGTNVSTYTKKVRSASASSAGSSLGRTGASGASGTRGEYDRAGGYVAAGFNANIASGYAKGLAAAKGAELARSALNAIKSTIKAASPSKVTLQYGKWVSEGFAIGIGRFTKYAERSGASLGQKTLDALSVSADAINDYTNLDYDIDPTIRPVLDLSEIQNGLNRMDGMLHRADGSLRVGFDGDSYARRVAGSMLAPGNRLAGVGSGAFGSATSPDPSASVPKTVNISVNLQYDASADANELARGIARAVQPYVVRGE